MSTIQHPVISIDVATPAPLATRPSLSEAGIVTVGAGLAVCVGVNGPAPWPALRAVIALAATAGALALVRRHGGRARASATVAMGLAGVIVGVGIGPAHAVATGFSLMTVAGIAAAVVGLVLAGGGTVRLTRLARGWRRLLVVPIVPAVFLLLLAPMVVAVLVTNVPPLALGDERPSDLGLVYEDVAVRTTDGVQLVGWYVPSRNGAAVVLRAGAGSVRTDVLDHAAVLARGGYGVLMLEARGHGGSGGDAHRWGWYGDLDIDAGVTFLESRADVVDGRIGVVGMSMGGEEAIGATGSDERIRAVVAEGATARAPSVEGATTGGVTGWVESRMAWVAEQSAALMTSAAVPMGLRDAAEAAAPRPILIIVAGDEDPERVAGAHIQAGAPNSVELWIVPDTGHTNGIKTHPEEWADRVIAFLDRSLV